MKLAARALVLVVLVFGIAALSIGARERSDVARIRKQLIGSYSLVSFVGYDQNGAETRRPYPVGQISYDAAGRMSAQLMGENRARMTTPRASEAERAAAYSSFISYFGHYTIDPEKRTVTHHVEGAMSPNMVGTDQVRYFDFSPDGKSLFLSVKTEGRVTGKLRWDRYPPVDGK